MSSLRSQYQEDPDALLLLHATGELTEEQALPLVARLAEDDALQACFQAVQNDLEALDRQFAALDAFNGLRAEHAARQAVAAIRDWQLGRPAVVESVAVAQTPVVRRPGMRSAVAAVLAVGLGLAAVATYLQRAPHTAQSDQLPDMVDSGDDSLALHAATSLATGPELDEDAPPASPMPPTSGEPLVATEQPFFDIPLIADADSAP